MILIFNRKVIPMPDKAAGPKDIPARVEAEVIGFIGGEPLALPIGMLKFPTKQSWTKFWGAIQRGSLQVPELEVRCENIMPEETDVIAPGPRTIGIPDRPVTTKEAPGATTK